MITALNIGAQVSGATENAAKAFKAIWLRGAATLSPILLPILGLLIKSGIPLLSNLAQWAANGMYGNGGAYELYAFNPFDPKSWAGMGKMVTAEGLASAGLMTFTVSGALGFIAAPITALLTGALTGAGSIFGMTATAPAWIPGLVAIVVGALAYFGLSSMTNGLLEMPLRALGLRAGDHDQRVAAFDAGGSSGATAFQNAMGEVNSLINETKGSSQAPIV